MGEGLILVMSILVILTIVPTALMVYCVSLQLISDRKTGDLDKYRLTLGGVILSNIFLLAHIFMIVLWFNLFI